jgi:divalent metal cation (Fe/Co/Zn/Cd) transporter
MSGPVDTRDPPALATEQRGRDLRRGLLLEYGGLAYNVFEAVVGLAAGIAANSVALIAFGLDSVIESASASVLVWRLRSETRATRTAEEAERLAVRLVAIAFFGLAAYVGARAVFDLIRETRPEESVPGIVLALVSVIVMPMLARLKRKAARALDSRALQADSRQTTLCTYLSAFLLVGLVANALFGWWWADPVAGLAIAAVAIREGRELWATDDLCCT